MTDHQRGEPAERVLDEFERDVAALEPIRKMWITRGGPAYVSAIESLLTEAAAQALCEAYADASDSRREEVRKVVVDHGAIVDRLEALVPVWRASMLATRDGRWFRLILLAASISNMGRDARDTLLALQSLVVEAVEAGLAPEPEIAAAAAMSGTANTGIGSPQELIGCLIEKGSSRSPASQR